MKRVTGFIFMIFLIASISGAASAVDNTASSGQDSPKKKTVFNMLSDYFRMFDKPFAKPGNNESLANASADWIKKLDK